MIRLSKEDLNQTLQSTDLKFFRSYGAKIDNLLPHNYKLLLALFILEIIKLIVNGLRGESSVCIIF